MYSPAPENRLSRLSPVSVRRMSSDVRLSAVSVRRMVSRARPGDGGMSGRLTERYMSVSECCFRLIGYTK
eukprot:1182670-Prorocentrum_minimum.AAC.2